MSHWCSLLSLSLQYYGFFRYFSGKILYVYQIQFRKKAASEVNEVITQKLDGSLDMESYKTKISNISRNGDFCVIVYDEDTSKDGIMGNESDGKCMLSKSASYAAHADVIDELKGKPCHRRME